MRITLDSNVLVYAFDPTDSRKHAIARDLVTRAMHADCVLTLQSICETFNVLTRKTRLPTERAERCATLLTRRFPVAEAESEDLHKAMRAVREHNLSFWDAMLWASSAAARCQLLISENFQSSRRLGPVLIADPFGSSLSPEIEAALAQSGG